MSGKLKPWHFVIFILAIAALAYGGYRAFVAGGTKDKLTDQIVAVDVVSGELFLFKAGKLFPAKHPDTGERTLLPAYKNEEGQWIIPGRYMSAVYEMDVETKAVVDRSSGLVQPASEELRRVP